MIKAITIWFIFFTSQSYAVESFQFHFEYPTSHIPRHADSITKYYTENPTISSKKRINIFKQFNEEISLDIKSQPGSAVLWFIKGLNFKNRLIALEEQKILGAKNIEPIIQQTKDFITQSFIEAINLDSKNKKTTLSAKIYGTMKHNLIGEERIKALQKEVFWGGSGDNETIYWFNHWDVIGSLQDEGRFEEAEEALYNMKKELASSGLEDSEFNQIYNQAKSNLAKDHVLSEKKEQQASKQSQPQNKKKNDPSIFENLSEKLENYWFMIVLNTIVFISLIVAFMRREKD